MSQTIYFLFSYYIDKNRYNFPAGQKKSYCDKISKRKINVICGS